MSVACGPRAPCSTMTLARLKRAQARWAKCWRAMKPTARSSWRSYALLLLTGCRKGEIVTLKWRDYRENKLFLRDSKTGPRTVWLSSPARAILDGLPREAPWIFPSPRTDSFLSAQALGTVWHRVRAEAGLSNVRLHDCRHTYASMALAQGETVLTIGRLLGHRDPATTLKYTHFADATAREAVDMVGAVLEG